MLRMIKTIGKFKLTHVVISYDFRVKIADINFPHTIQDDNNKTFVKTFEEYFLRNENIILDH